MLILILQSAIISIIFIFLVHQLLGFFKNTLTVPKVKDFVVLPAQKYEKMFNILNRQRTDDVTSHIYFLPTSGASNPYDDTIDAQTLKNTTANTHNKGSTSNNSMKTELKSFLKKHLDSSKLDIRPIELENFDQSSSSFSSF